MHDIRKMQVGQIVDFCISFNERQQTAEQTADKEKDRPKKRKATQAEINAYFGR